MCICIKLWLWNLTSERESACTPAEKIAYVMRPFVKILLLRFYISWPHLPCVIRPPYGIFATKFSRAVRDSHTPVRLGKHCVHKHLIIYAQILVNCQLATYCTARPPCTFYLTLYNKERRQVKWVQASRDSAAMTKSIFLSGTSWKFSGQADTAWSRVQRTSAEFLRLQFLYKENVYMRKTNIIIL